LCADGRCGKKRQGASGTGQGIIKELELLMASKPGLYANIHAKQERIERQKAEGGKVERMRSPGAKGAPTAAAFKQSAKTAKK
jgi:hypothetical protein